VTKYLGLTSTSKITKGLSLHKNFSWNLVGNIVYAGCQWGILIVLAKLTSTEVVGQFALALAVSAPVFLLSQLQLRGVQATDARNEYLFGHYLGLRIVTTALAMAVVVGIAFYGYDRYTALVITAVALSKLFESVSDVFYGLMQKHERMDRIAISMMVKGPLSLFTLGLVVWMTQNLLWGILAMAAVWGGILCTFDFASGKKILYATDIPNATHSIRPVFDLKRILKLAWLALPLGLVMALLSLNTNIPRYFIESYHGKSELGIFAALVYLVTVGGLVINAMGQSATPRLAKYYAIGDIKSFSKLLLRLLLIGVGMGVAGVFVAFFFGEIVLNIIYGAAYAERKNVFICVVIAGAASYIAAFCGYGVTAARAFPVQLFLCIGVTVTTAAIAPYLIRLYGLNGAAYVLIISGLLTAFVYAIALGLLLYKSKTRSRP
jgi:O-antigen/teichoic acid export membrane protein